MMIKTVWSQRLKDYNHSLSKLIQAQQYKHTVKLIYLVPP